MPRYTDKDRRKSLATRKRNAQIRRGQIAKLGYNPNNPTVKLADNVIVTKTVEKKLTKQAETSTPFSVLDIILIVIINVFIILFFVARPFTVMNFTLLIPAVIAGTITTIRYSKRVKSRTYQLALERQERIEERNQFYSSPEWRQVRTQVIKEHGSICSECGIKIKNRLDVTVDHIQPRSKYPELALNIENLRVLCRSCNSQKGDRDSEIYVDG